MAANFGVVCSALDPKEEVNEKVTIENQYKITQNPDLFSDLSDPYNETNSKYLFTLFYIKNQQMSRQIFSLKINWKPHIFLHFVSSVKKSLHFIPILS